MLIWTGDGPADDDEPTADEEKVHASAEEATAAKGIVHVSKFGTYHPDPKADVAWTINDTRGYVDGGPPCDICGVCECDPSCDGDQDDDQATAECIGLSFAFICLDGGESLCEMCATTEGIVIMKCNCA